MRHSFHICQPETVLFIGAGASAQLAMPTTDEQAGILFKLCDSARVGEEQITAKCFLERKREIIALLTLLDYPGDSIHDFTETQERHFEVAFPGLSGETAKGRTVQLRRTFDWPALKAVAKKLKDSNLEYDENDKEKIPENYLQGVFDLIDVLLREERGVELKQGDRPPVFLGRERLLAARECLIMLVNTMFACAWQDLATTADGQERLRPYRAFADALAELMEDEALQLERVGHPLHRRSFYLFSYSVLTTNFEPIFLWLIYQAHKKRNWDRPARLGHPGKKLQLMLDFPNTVGMHTLADDAERSTLKRDITYPYTEAVVQKVNDERHLSDRVARVGKYYFVHGSSNFRHCPRCGRLNLYVGDSWDENSPTLFAPGVIAPFAWGVRVRTDAEKEARKRGEYDAMECLFCGQMTYAQHNFMHMQTHFKGRSPSFLKEITDEALAGLTGVKHVVLLGYSFPTDDTIWASNFRAMIARENGGKVFCTVVCGYDKSDDWKTGASLQAHLNMYDRFDEEHGGRALRNAIAIFGETQVRAYTGGIPQVFRYGDKEFIRELLYPTAATWPGLPEIFTADGVDRRDFLRP